MTDEIVIKIDGDVSLYTETLNVIDERLETLKQNIITMTGEIVNVISVQLSQEVLPELISKINELNLAMQDSTQKSASANESMSAFDATVLAVDVASMAMDIVGLVKGLNDLGVVAKVAAGAHQLLNIAMNATPTGWALTGIAAACSAIIVYESSHKSAIKEITKENERIIASMDEISKKYEDFTLDVEDKIGVEDIEAETISCLCDKLLELEDQYNTIISSGGDATEVEESFATVAEELEEIIPGISKCLYDETGQISVQEAAIQTLISSYVKLAQAKALASAAEAELTKINAQILAVQLDKNEAEEGLKTIKTAKGNMPEDTVFSYEVITAQGAIDEANNKLAFLEKNRDYIVNELTSAVTDEYNAQNTINAITGAGKVSKNTSSYGGYTQTTPAKQARDELDNIYKMGEISTDEYYKRIGVIRDTYLAEGSEEWKKYTLELIEYEQEKIKEGLESELALIDEAHKNGELSDAEYYKALQAYRDKYFTEGCANWDKYTDDIFKINEECIASQKEAIRNVFDDITKYADDSINSVLEKRNALEDKLKGEGGFFKKVTINDGNGEETLFTFGNTDEHKKTSEEFTNALVEAEKRLKDTGLISNFANFIFSVYHCLTNISCKHIISV